MQQSHVTIRQALKIAKDLYDKRQWRRAARVLEQVVRRRPRNAEAQRLYAKVLMHLSRPAEAESALRQALAAAPDHPGLLNTLGLCLVLLGRLDEARPVLDRVEARTPQNPMVHRNLGLLHLIDNEYEAAEKSLRRALQLEPGFTSALANLGNTLQSMGRFDEAIDAFDRALSQTPDDASIRNDRGMCRLRAGDYERGFADYEARLRRHDQIARHRRIEAPPWDGSDFDGKTLVVYGEQGYGDIIHCARFMPMVKARGGTVVFQAKPPIKRLLGTVDGIDEVVTTDDERPPVDLKLPVFSLPGLFETRWPDVPADVPYIRVAEEADAPLDGAGLRVGLVWAGSAIFKGDHTRSMPPEHFVPLLDVPGVTLYNLQFGESAAGFDERIRDLGDDVLGDFYQTGGIIEKLDLVISVDTATVHLAGALNRPVWALLAYACDWRWGAQGDRSPWYPSVRLYRQPEPKAWDKVIERVAEDLAELAAAKR